MHHEVSASPQQVYENKNYVILVGVPPATKDDPEPVVAYLIYNKKTEVLEYFHSVLFHARGWADHFSDMLDKLESGVNEEWGAPPQQGEFGLN